MYGEITKIEEIAYHRNGVGGVGFHVINFLYKEEGDDTEHKMMGVVFELPEDSQQLADEGKFYNPPTAVFNRDLLAMNDIAFGSNSYRGDTFDAALREAIEKDLSEKRGFEIIECGCEAPAVVGDDGICSGCGAQVVQERH